jgi:hypothetical protein
MRRARILVIWLLMLALPFQGYAAASMLACVTENAVVAADSMTSMSAAPDQALDADHDGAHGSVAKSAADTPGTASPDVDHGCSLCNLCSACHGIAFIDAPSFATGSPLPQADLIEPEAAPAAVPARPLEKPPRA